MDDFWSSLSVDTRQYAATFNRLAGTAARITFISRAACFCPLGDGGLKADDFSSSKDGRLNCKSVFLIVLPSFLLG